MNIISKKGTLDNIYEIDIKKLRRTYKKLMKYVSALIIKLMDKKDNNDIVLSEYKKRMVRFIRTIKKILENSDKKTSDQIKGRDIEISELIMKMNNVKNIYRYINEYFD